jgi:N-carbamoylputrescine amidase
MRTVSLAALQFACTWDREQNVATAERLIRLAAGQGAQIILIPELFEAPYFCAVQEARYLDLARPLHEHPTVQHLRGVAAELGVVIPVSVYERAGVALFNTVVVVDADGKVLGHYRKSHIPQAPGYEEKYYFSPGDTGFEPFTTAYGKLGVAICWDQWFPEVARSLVLRGAEFLMYPTAIGSEPNDPDVDSMEHWRIVMRGHAGANMVPVVAANRVGRELTGGVSMTFYGSSFIADHLGALAATADRESEQVLVQRFDLEACRAYRQSWGCFRDRRSDLYGALMSLDGASRKEGHTALISRCNAPHSWPSSPAWPHLHPTRLHRPTARMSSMCMRGPTISRHRSSRSSRLRREFMSTTRCSIRRIRRKPLCRWEAPTTTS